MESTQKESRMKVRFYGVRGSIPTPGKNTVEYGGNTSCIEILSSSGRECILDAGSGIRELGNDLMARYKGRVKADVFISHEHWDHIQGFPFFVPAYVPGCEVTVYSGDKKLAQLLDAQNRRTDTAIMRRRGIESIAAGDTVVLNKAPNINHTKKVFMAQQDRERGLFPVKVEDMGATLKFTDLKGKSVSLDENFRIEHLCHEAHPQGMFAYKVCEGEKKVVFTGDYEHDGENGVFGKNDTRLIEFSRGADILIMDGQYTPEEYPKKKGWGHSQIERACELAVAAGVKRLCITHHDPMHNDSQLREMEERARKYSSEKLNSDIAVTFAREGAEIEV